MKNLILFSTLLLIVSCQPKRKTCKFQGVEVSCQALEQQIEMQQAQAQAQAQTTPASEKPVEATGTAVEDEAETDPTRAEVRIFVAINVSGNKIEFLENKEDVQLLAHANGEVACKISTRAGEIAYFKFVGKHLMLKNGITMKFTRQTGEKGLLGSWTRKVRSPHLTKQTSLELNNLKYITLTKSCQLN